MRMWRTCIVLMASVLCSHAQADEQLWSLLKRGKQVVLMRHTITTPGVGDPADMRLDDCSSQRNLTEEGREHARQAGRVFRMRGVPIDRVLTSPWCRCVETAALAFGKGEPSASLSNLFGRTEHRVEQVQGMHALIAAHVASHGRGNLILVSHGSTILALTGVQLDTGEMLVVTPQAGGQFKIEGRLAAHAR